jgi:hypothetical protein
MVLTVVAAARMRGTISATLVSADACPLRAAATVTRAASAWITAEIVRATAVAAVPQALPRPRWTGFTPRVQPDCARAAECVIYASSTGSRAIRLEAVACAAQRAGSARMPVAGTVGERTGLIPAQVAEHSERCRGRPDAAQEPLSGDCGRRALCEHIGGVQEAIWKTRMRAHGQTDPTGDDWRSVSTRRASVSSSSRMACLHACAIRSRFESTVECRTMKSRSTIMTNGTP